MNNLLKSKTRLAFIQIIFENISTSNDIFKIYENFNTNYKSTYIENFHDKKKIKFEFNSGFLKKLVTYFDDYTKDQKYLSLIDKHITFNRSFKKWDFINQSIFLAAMSELKNTEKQKIKIIFNDYLNVGKSFVDEKEIGMINALLDKIIYEEK